MRVAILMEATRASGPARNLLYALDLLRHEVEVRFFAFRRPGDRRSEFVSVLEVEGYGVEVIDEAGPFDPRAAVRLCRRLAEMNPDVVQVHNTKSRLFTLGCAATGRLDRRRLLFFFHGETWVDAKQRWYNRLDRLLLRRTPLVAVVSPYQAGLLASWGIPGERIRVIPNAIPETPASVRPASPRPVVITAGRLSAEKGHGVLLEAVADLRRRRGECLVLRIYGEGPEMESLRRQARDLGLSGTVEFMGHVADMGAAYGQADLFVLPSLSEGLPNVLLEAAMLGVPILSTAVGGVPFLFRDGEEAVLVPAGSAAGLARAIGDFIDSPVDWQRRAEAARERVVRENSPETKARLLMAAWREMCTRPGLEATMRKEGASDAGR